MRLHKSKDKMLAGVCGGIGEYFGIDATVVRAITVLFFLSSSKTLLVYVLFALLMPEERDIRE